MAKNIIDWTDEELRMLSPSQFDQALGYLLRKKLVNLQQINWLVDRFNILKTKKVVGKYFADPYNTIPIDNVEQLRKSVAAVCNNQGLTMEEKGEAFRRIKQRAKQLNVSISLFT